MTGTRKNNEGMSTKLSTLSCVTSMFLRSNPNLRTLTDRRNNCYYEQNKQEGHLCAFRPTKLDIFITPKKNKIKSQKNIRKTVCVIK